MKSLFIPYGQKNPYQQELAEALGRQGIRVINNHQDTLLRKWLPIFNVIRTHGRPDVLHLHWVHQFLIEGDRQKSLLTKAIPFFAELLAVKLLRIKIVWTVHNLLEHNKRDTQLELFFLRLLVPLCDQVIVHCSFAREAVMQTYQLPDHFKDRISVIPHGHYINSYENQLTREQARTELDLGEEEIIFLHIGAIRPYKGVPQLISTFRELKHPQARLLIAGKPGKESIREELIESCQLDSRIRTSLKFIPDDEIQLFMSAADVVVLPYQDVFTSGSALLAMSFSKAVIIPRRGCVSEVLDEQGGFLYSPCEEAGLLKAMNQALTADLATMGQYNYHKAKNFDWDMIGQQTSEVYHRCNGAGVLEGT